jgi:ribosomal protein S14
MLKINSRNENLNRRMVKKEVTQLLYHLALCFFYQNFASSKQNYVQKYFSTCQLKLLTFLPFTKTRTLCFLTGRSRSIYRSFRLSRLKIREYAGSGYFPGLSKASW